MRKEFCACRLHIAVDAKIDCGGRIGHSRRIGVDCRVKGLVKRDAALSGCQTVLAKRQFCQPCAGLHTDAGQRFFCGDKAFCHMIVSVLRRRIGIAPAGDQRKTVLLCSRIEGAADSLPVLVADCHLHIRRINRNTHHAAIRAAQQKRILRRFAAGLQFDRYGLLCLL